MGHWGVASPQPGRIEGQPIIDMRLEDIRAAQIEAQAAAEANREDYKLWLYQKSSNTLSVIDENNNKVIELLKQNHIILKDVIALHNKRQAQTALITHLELMDRLKGIEESFITRTNNIEQHLFEHLAKSTKWWLANVLWPYLNKPLWSSNGNS